MSQNPDKSLIDELRNLIMPIDYYQKFLQKRNFCNENDENFGINHNSKLLRNYAGEKFKDDVPFVIFYCMPKLDLEIDITSEKFKEWIDNNKITEIESHKITTIPYKQKFDLDSITFNNDYNGQIGRYVEFVENGYVENGFTFPLIYDYNNDLPPALNLGRTTVTFWAFLMLCKNYYNFIKFKDGFEMAIIIHNAKNLALAGFNGKLPNNMIWSDPYKDRSGDDLPKTYRNNIILKKKLDSISQLTDSNVKKIIRHFSDKLANGYGLEFSRSYNYDGSMPLEHFDVDR